MIDHSINATDDEPHWSSCVQWLSELADDALLRLYSTNSNMTFVFIDSKLKNRLKVYLFSIPDISVSSSVQRVQ